MAFDENGRSLHGRVEFFEHNVRELSKYMSAVVGEHSRGVSSSLGFTERLRVVAAQEPFADLQDRMVGLAEFTEKMCEERRSVICERAKANIVNKLDEVLKLVIQPTKTLLKDRGRAIHALTKATEEFEIKKEQGKLEVPPISLVEMKHAVRNTERVVDNNMELFESQRIEDMKDIIEEFIRCEMYYHCRALEVLGPALSHISKLDSIGAHKNIKEDIDALNEQMCYN